MHPGPTLHTTTHTEHKTSNTLTCQACDALIIELKAAAQVQRREPRQPRQRREPRRMHLSVAQRKRLERARGGAQRDQRGVADAAAA